MKLKNKLLKDISIRLISKNKESSKRSLKILFRLGISNYLSILDNLSKLGKDSNSCKEKNRCFITSRSSGNYVKASLSRMKVKELINSGLVLGFTKASW